MRSRPQSLNCDSSETRGRLPVTMIGINVLSFLEKWRNNFLDYIARNHEEQIHCQIDDYGSNYVMRAYLPLKLIALNTGEHLNSDPYHNL